MAAALTFLLISTLLQGVEGRSFSVNMPQIVKVMRGSCVTVPCSFDIKSEYDKDLNENCKPHWVDSDYMTPQLTETNPVTGDVTNKNCTTTFFNIRHDYNSQAYFFRLVCNNFLKWTFEEAGVKFLVTGDLPPPTLSQSTLKVKEGTSVSLTCSAPAPCLPHPPTLTWTPKLGESQETLQENQDKTKVQTSVLTFTASHLHHGQKISCTAVYKKQDGSSAASVTSSLTAYILYSTKNTTVSVSPSGPVPENSTVTLTCSSDANPPVKIYTWYRADGDQETLVGIGSVLNIQVSKVRWHFFCMAENDLGVGRSNESVIDVQFPPQILPSSDCTKTSSTINCSCEAVGNPSPTLRWYLNGVPVNQSNVYESLNGTSLRSVVTVNQPQENLPVLSCHSFNSLGSASQQFCFNSHEISAGKQGVGSNSGVLSWVLAGLSLGFNIIFILCIAFLCKGRRNEKHKPEERTYMSLDRRDVIGSSEYDVIAQQPK